MKQLTVIAIVMLMAVLPITGCNKASNSTLGLYYMKATIGTATLFSAEGLSKATESTSYSAGLNLTYIFGKASNGQAIKIAVTSASPLSITTIPFNTGIATAYFYPVGLDSSFSAASSGSLVITALLPNVEGTFNFITDDSTVVTNGTFSVLAQR